MDFDFRLFFLEITLCCFCSIENCFQVFWVQSHCNLTEQINSIIFFIQYDYHDAIIETQPLSFFLLFHLACILAHLRSLRSTLTSRKDTPNLRLYSDFQIRFNKLSCAFSFIIHVDRSVLGTDHTSELTQIGRNRYGANECSQSFPFRRCYFILIYLLFKRNPP